MAGQYFMTTSDRATQFQPNEKVRTISSLGGAQVTVRGVYDLSLDLWTIRTQDGRELVVSGPSLERRTPTWRAGDVIVVRHHGVGPKYTYVRGSSSKWLTEHGGHTDDTINSWYRAGWATPLLQDGGQVFDPARL